MRHFIFHFSVITILFVVSSCSSPEKQENPNKKQIAKDTTSDQDTVESKVDSLPNDVDTPLTSRQKDAIIKDIHLLENTSYHNDEVDPELAQKDWYGIFEEEGITLIKKVKVKIENEHDAIVDLEGEKTGWKVTIDQGEKIVFLISGIQLDVKEIKSFDFEQDWLQPGDTLSFDYRGQQYEIIAKGEYPQGKKESYNIKNFELYLRMGSITQKLFTIPRNDDATPKVLWVGDLDQDGKLDLIVNTTHHYNAYVPTLYLSSFAEKGALVKEVAKRTSVGC